MTQSGIDKFMELAEQGREMVGTPKGIGFSAEDLKDLKAAKRSKSIRAAFALAATGLSATAAFIIVKDPLMVHNFLRALDGQSEPLQSIAAQSTLRELYTFGMLGLLTNLTVSLLWMRPIQTIDEKLKSIWRRQNERAFDIQKEKLDKAERGFIKSLTHKNAADLTQADYDTIVLCSPENKTGVTNEVGYSRVLDSEINLGNKSFADHLGSSFKESTKPTTKDLTNTLWILPAMLSFTAPLFALASLIGTTIPTPKQLELSEPEMPDLKKLKSTIMSEVMLEKTNAAVTATPTVL